MFRKILGALGMGAKEERPAGAAGAIRPYREESPSFIYNLLFCDDRSLYKAPGDAEPWATLLAASPDAGALRRIAEDASQEGRVRMLAFNRLREMGEPVPPKVLLGTIVEVGMREGLDTLATFTDGGVRYIHHTGTMSIYEGTPHPVEEQARRLLAASQPVVERIGPWTEARLPPPGNGMVRMTFLVSDGLHFGQGPYDAMVGDPMAGPLLAAAHDLLAAVVDAWPRQQKLR